MNTTDLNSAYAYESQRRVDEMAEAKNCRLIAECTKTGKKAAYSPKHLLSLLAAFIVVFVKRWS